MSRLSRILATLCLVLFLTQGMGCAAQKASKKGLEWEEQNEPHLAAESYMVALSHNSKKTEYLVALKRVSKEGYDALLLLAQTSQKNENYPKAVDYYKRLKTYTDTLSRYDALNFSIINVDLYISDMSRAAAKERYDAGKNKQKQKSYADSIKEFEKALSFVPNYEDSKAQIAESYYLWAEEVLETDLYKAGQLFEKSSLANGTHKDATKRAAQVYYTIGRFYLNRGYCQEALKYLTPAKALVSSNKITKKWFDARACSSHQLGVVSYRNERKDRQLRLAINQLLAEELLKQLASHAAKETYLKVGDLSLSNYRKDVFTEPAIDSFDRLLLAEHSRVGFEQENWKKSIQTTTGTLWDRCPDRQDLCSSSVQVQYVLRTQESSILFRGTLRIFQTSNQQVLWSKPFDQTHRKTLRYADTFQVDGINVTVGKEKALGVVVLNEEIHLLAQGTRTLRKEDLLRESIQKVAQDFSTLITRAAADDPNPPVIPKLKLATLD